MTQTARPLWPLVAAAVGAFALLATAPYLASVLSSGDRASPRPAATYLEPEAGPAPAERPPLVVAAQAPYDVAPGDIVEIRGAGFGTSAAVTVGYKFVYQTEVTDSRVMVVAPEMAPGAYDVAVTTPDGRKAVAKGLLVYGGETAIAADVAELAVGSDGAAITVRNLTNRALTLAAVRVPPGYTVEMPNPRVLAAEGTAVLGVTRSATAAADFLVLQGGTTRLSIALQPGVDYESLPVAPLTVEED